MSQPLFFLIFIPLSLGKLNICQKYRVSLKHSQLFQNKGEYQMNEYIEIIHARETT
jgi:hypothetical protein